MPQVILTTKNGTTYVYESTSYYDKEKKQSRPLRKLIVKIDPKTGEVVPTGQRGRPRKQLTHQDTPQTIRTIQSYGGNYLLQQLANKTGITDDLKSVFPKDYLAILSLAIFLTLKPNNALRKYENGVIKQIQ